MGYEKIAKRSDAQLAKHIRELSKTPAAVYFTKHAKAQMVRRKVSTLEVFECIRNGTIRRAPEVSNDGESLECRIERYVAGRELAVIVALCDEDPNIVLVTVFVTA